MWTQRWSWSLSSIQKLWGAQIQSLQKQNQCQYTLSPTEGNKTQMNRLPGCWSLSDTDTRIQTMLSSFMHQLCLQKWSSSVYIQLLGCDARKPFKCLRFKHLAEHSFKATADLKLHYGLNPTDGKQCSFDRKVLFFHFGSVFFLLYFEQRNSSLTHLKPFKLLVMHFAVLERCFCRSRSYATCVKRGQRVAFECPKCDLYLHVTSNSLLHTCLCSNRQGKFLFSALFESEYNLTDREKSPGCTLCWPWCTAALFLYVLSQLDLKHLKNFRVAKSNMNSCFQTQFEINRKLRSLWNTWWLIFTRHLFSFSVHQKIW